MNYFESYTRDGPGRIGLLKSDEKEIDTPCLIDLEAEIENSGTTWIEDNEGIDNPDFYVPEYKRCPPGLDMDYARYLGMKSLEVVDGLEEEDFGSLLMPVVGGGRYSQLRKEFAAELSDYHAVVIDMADELYIPHELVSVVVSVKKNVGFDTAVYAPSVATPPLVPLLIYMGVDLLDSYKAFECAFDEVFFTYEGVQEIEQLNETPCHCETCLENTITDIRDMDPENRFKAIYSHNKKILKGELKRTRNAIRRGLLRELVEERVKSSPGLTTSLRKLDFEYSNYLENQTPIYRRYQLNANTYESLHRPEINRFIDRVKNRYRSPGSNVAVILPCSAKKPYSKSDSHSIYRRGTKGRGDEVILTSPLGIVPRELEVVYPAQHYDLPVTGVWSEEEKKLIKNCLKNYFEKNKYIEVVVHVDGELAELSREVLNQMDFETTYTTPNKDPRSNKSIEELDNALEGYEKRENRFRDMVRSIADYQFGIGMGEKLLEDAVVKGGYPRFRVDKKDGSHLATLSPEYGVLALTIEGATKTKPSRYKIEIGGFYPEGSLLAPGVIDASTEIKPNDEVWFEGKKAIGVGRAQMSGKEMKSSERGISVKIRHVEEK